jgi:hypothetical protein
MAETRRKFDQGFKEGAVRLVRETGKPIAQVARELGVILSFRVSRACDLRCLVVDSVRDETPQCYPGRFQAG